MQTHHGTKILATILGQLDTSRRAGWRVQKRLQICSLCVLQNANEALHRGYSERGTGSSETGRRVGYLLKRIGCRGASLRPHVGALEDDSGFLLFHGITKLFALHNKNGECSAEHGLGNVFSI